MPIREKTDETSLSGSLSPSIVSVSQSDCEIEVKRMKKMCTVILEEQSMDEEGLAFKSFQKLWSYHRRECICYA